MACSSECRCSVARYNVFSVPRYYFQIPLKINEQLVPLIYVVFPNDLGDMVNLGVEFPQSFVVVVQYGGIIDI